MFCEGSGARLHSIHPFPVVPSKIVFGSGSVRAGVMRFTGCAVSPDSPLRSGRPAVVVHAVRRWARDEEADKGREKHARRRQREGAGRDLRHRARKTGMAERVAGLS